jgi:hypothetical protein
MKQKRKEKEKAKAKAAARQAHPVSARNQQRKPET